MKFCRNCGSALAAPAVGAPGPAPLAAHGAPHGAAPAAPVAAPVMAPPLAPPPSPPPGISSSQAGGSGSSSGSRPVAQGSTITCPRCGTSTPLGFSFCQQCGLQVQAPPSPGAQHASGPVPSAPVSAPGGPAISPHAPVDPQGATLAADGVRAGSIASPAGQVGATPRAWGTAVLVNRDGTDGQRFALGGEYVVIGRAGADIAFDDDRFLARQHARLERAADGSVHIHPLDTLNGVFRKTDRPVELVDGLTILVGREVLRFEKLDLEEVKAHALVRHGVALFGSPPREPWGRLVQLVPSGGYRDVRHLVGNEVVLGREEGDLVFRDDAFMSRRHAALTWDGHKGQLTDLGSSNGTFVRITGATALAHGAHLRMGDQLLRIELGA